MAGFERGFVSSTSLLVGAVGAASAALLAKEHEFPVGLHLNFTAGRPLAKPETISTLVDSNGSFLGRTRFTTRCMSGGIEPDHVRVEAEAQLNLFGQMIGTPSHFDGHHHVHCAVPIADVVAPLFRARGLDRVRIPTSESPEVRADAAAGASDSRLVSDVESAREVYRAHGYSWPSEFVGNEVSGYNLTLDRVGVRLREAPDGAEFMVHIARRVDMRGGYPSPTRFHEFDTLASREFEALLHSLEFELISFRNL